MTPPDVGILLNLLSLLNAQYNLYYAAHWKSSGPTFNADHQLFSRLYEAAQGEADTMAEKIIGFHGVAALDHVQLAASVAGWLSQWKNAGSVLEQAITAEQALQDALEKAVHQLESAGQYTLGLQNFLPGVADTHESHLYLLQQRMSPVPTDKVASAASLRDFLLGT